MSTRPAADLSRSLPSVERKEGCGRSVTASATAQKSSCVAPTSVAEVISFTELVSVAEVVRTGSMSLAGLVAEVVSTGSLVGEPLTIVAEVLKTARGGSAEGPGLDTFDVDGSDGNERVQALRSVWL